MMVNRGGRAEDMYMEWLGVADTAAAGTVAKPSGVAVGDVVLVFTADVNGAGSAHSLATSGGATWAKSLINDLGAGYEGCLWCKVLNATDIANSWLISGTHTQSVRAVAWRGNDAAGVSVRSTTASPIGQSILTLPGFAPDNTHAALSVLIDRDPGGAPTVGGGFTVRSTAAVSSGPWTAAVADNLDGYAGENVVWTVDVGFAEYGWLVEVTAA